MYNTKQLSSANLGPSRSGPSLLALAVYFAWLGTIGFGGPIALAGKMEQELVERRRWIRDDEFRDGLALAQLAPGPLAAQLAMYLGHVLYGFWGATIVAVAFIAPSFLMVVAIGVFYANYGGFPLVQSVLYGVGPAVIGIIAISSIRLAKKIIRKDRLLWIIFASLAATTAVTGNENVLLFFGSGLLTLLVRGNLISRRSTMGGLLPILPLLGTHNEVLRIFLFFAKAALFVFGSGLAIVPFLHAGVVQEHHWLTEEQFLDAVAVALITPGPVVITVAFIGFLVAGLPGALAAAAGVFLPVYAVVILLAPLYKRFSERAALKGFVAGVTAAATGALAGAVVVLGTRSIHDLTSGTIALATAAALLRWKVPEPVVIVAAGVFGIVAHR